MSRGTVDPAATDHPDLTLGEFGQCSCEFGQYHPILTKSKNHPLTTKFTNVYIEVKRISNEIAWRFPDYYELVVVIAFKSYFM